MKSFGFTFAAVAVGIFLLTVLTERILIPILRARKLGQKILDIGPRWHKSKEGTPTMGGIGFILPTLLVMAVFFIVRAVQGRSAEYIPLAVTLAYAVANGAVGFVDDYCKLIKKQNEGLKWWQKLILQTALAAGYVAVMCYTGFMSTSVPIPFYPPFLSYIPNYGWIFYPLAVIVLVGVVNGGNITDGIDGLASSVTGVIGIFFAVWAFLTLDEQLSLTSAILIGASLGFLIYNFYPARVFMGDTGSLFFGALVIGSAFMNGNPIVGLIVSAVFILEMLSSFLQVAWFKISGGKRLFKMAPIHHHFEKCGWSEIKIVAVFSAVAAIFCLIAFFALGLQFPY